VLVTTNFSYYQENYTFASFTSAHGGPVEDLAFELTHRRLASVGHGSLQVWELKSDCKQFTMRSAYAMTESSQIRSGHFIH
jgi:hypothetical protein